MSPSDPASSDAVASSTPARHFAVMPAAGTGSRVGAGVPKQYLDLAGRPMLARTAEALVAAPWIERVVVVVAPGDLRAAEALAGLCRVTVLAEGGVTRRDSVLAGLRALVAREGALASDWALVHDAARPGVDRDSLERLRSMLDDDEVGGLLALPVSDTVKRSTRAPGEAAGGGAPAPLPTTAERVARTLPRDGLWLAQTPQMFRIGLLLGALERFADVTDEAAAIERLGRAPRLVEGIRDNFKVTTPGDLEAMRRLFGHHRGFGATRLRGSDGEAMGERDDTVTADGRQHPAPAAPATASRLRVGQGYDVHALVPGRPLRIGGVQVPHGHGLLGHSDADVLLHAITDALLGAAALGDIGRHFPDTDPRFSGADSAVLLAEAVRRVRNAGFELLNIDATVIAQAPKLAPHIPGMVAGIAQTLGIDPARVNIKAKTSERLGFAGRGEGIEASAVVLLSG